MVVEPIYVLLLVSVLVVKHFLVDFLAQTPYMYKNKGTYGHFGGILHALMHGIISLRALCPLAAMLNPTCGYARILACCLDEIIIHYHIDFFKVKVCKKYELTPVNSEVYWYILGLDQLLHYTTYILMVLVLST